VSTQPAAKILVVDDTPAKVKLWVDVLGMSGYVASAATNGEDALAQGGHIIRRIVHAQ
jgi:CheY-like chemotaxis protein